MEVFGEIVIRFSFFLTTSQREMVFEKYVVQLLDKYLSDYIENVDYKKLKIDMWSGIYI